jgi:tRNA/rRNA methyltransferase
MRDNLALGLRFVILDVGVDSSRASLRVAPLTRQSGVMVASARRARPGLNLCPVVLVRPRYPENLGAVARAMRVTGFERLVLVAPHPLAVPDHPQARRMAVGSLDILDGASTVPSLVDAVAEADWTIATSARSGVCNVTPRRIAPDVLDRVMLNQRIAIVFGGERAGLRRTEVDGCDAVVRIPMVGNEPSVNLAQSVMIVLYELMVEALARV